MFAWPFPASDALCATLAVLSSFLPGPVGALYKLRRPHCSHAAGDATPAATCGPTCHSIKADSNPVLLAQLRGSGSREAATEDDTGEVDDGVGASTAGRPDGGIYGPYDGPDYDDDDDDDEQMEPEQFCTNCTGTLVGDLCLVTPPPPPRRARQSCACLLRQRHPRR